MNVNVNALSLGEEIVSPVEQISASSGLLIIDKSDVLIHYTALDTSNGGGGMIISSGPGPVELSLGSDDPLGDDSRNVVSGDCCAMSSVYGPHTTSAALESAGIGLGEPQALFEFPDMNRCIYEEQEEEQTVSYSTEFDDQIDHIDHHPTTEMSSVCKLCNNRKFKSKSSLESHNSAFHKNVDRSETTKSIKLHRNASSTDTEIKTPKSSPANPDKKTTPDELELVLNGPPFVCNVCRKKLQTVSEFRRHMLTRHKKGRPFTCKFCPMRFKSQELLLNHTATHQLGISKKKVFAHVCELCQKPFASKYHLDNHLLNHSHTYKYKCNYCSKCFKWKSSFRYHIMYMHTDDRPHPCDICQKRFISGYHLNRHYRRLHSDARPHQCDRCLKCFKLPEDLARHKSHVHTENRKYECEECPAKFKTRGVLKKHKILHEIRRQMSTRGKSQTFCCDICTKVFPKLSSLQCHKLVHGREAEHGCSHCDEVFRFVSELKNHLLEAHHMKMHVKRSRQRKHQCEVCGATFISDRALMSHTEKHDPTGRYRCDQCGAGYHSRGDLSNHLLVDHGCRREEKNKVIPCELCEATYATKAGWRKHMDQVHSDSPRPVFECPICQNRFKCEDTVKSHIRFVHNPDSVERLHCEDCRKEFKRPSDLRAHRRRHLATPKFQCTHCSRSYRDRSSLNYHVRQKHTSSIDKFVEMCKLCKTVYKTREELRKHAVIHYDPISMLCKICDKQFTAQKTLWRHVRYHIMDQALVSEQPTTLFYYSTHDNLTTTEERDLQESSDHQHENATLFLDDTQVIVNGDLEISSV